jgi:hypothetical protein
MGDGGSLRLRWLHARRRALDGTEFRDQPVFAALRRRGPWAEGHLFFLPRRIERGEVLGVVVRLGEDSCRG